MPKKSSSHLSWTPAALRELAPSLLENRAQARQNAEQSCQCVADRFVLTFCFFFVKQKESIKREEAQ
ncbi:MAG: hypothetical protein ACYDCN_08340 [Bacteroidia bacterium]